MTRVISCEGRTALLLPLLLSLLLLGTALVLLLSAQPATAASVMEEDRPMDEKPGAVEGDARTERVVVAPQPPHWTGWQDVRDRYDGRHRSAPRVKVWVDRGDWATYRQGDRLWVYFRVDRPCYVTILDYSPDGRVETIFPNRWSGSGFVSPGRTYVIPESRRYSLRIAGSGGVETLVACAHESPWPSGPGGVWIPQHHPGRGRVVVGRPGGSPPPGWRGRVVVGPGHWPVPPRWYDTPERWSCDSVSFYVAGDVHGGSWGGVRGEVWWGGPGDRGPDISIGGRYDWDDRYGWDDYYEWEDWEDSDWDGDRDGRGRTLVSDRFRMEECSDRYSVGFDMGPENASVRIECTGSSHGDATEVVGRLLMDDHWGDDVLFRLDVEGDTGERPERGRVYARRYGRTSVVVEITDFKLVKTKEWQVPRFKWIEFDVRVFRG